MAAGCGQGSTQRELSRASAFGSGDTVVVALRQVTKWLAHAGDGVVRSTRLEQPSAAASVTDGAIVIAAITGCTNTSNPSVMKP
jgi:aconitase A